MVEPLEALLQRSLGEQYQVERELGRGGMATVFLARDLKHGRQVALKVVHPGLAAMMGTERFRREIEIAANLNHPHILPVLDSGIAGDLPYYVMPYVEGESLRQRLVREGTIPLTEALRLSREIASALDASHRLGLIHRDIKPENVLLNDGSAGHAVVADFGIARATANPENLTGTGMSLGTPSYMSPEQAVGAKDLDGRSDQYSLACLVYEMLSGRPPFEGNFHEVIVRHATAPVPPIATPDAEIPAQVEAALGKALAKNPADRFDTATAFVEMMAGTGGQPAPMISRATGPVPVTRPVRRRWVGIVAAVVLIAAIAAAVYRLRGAGPGSEGPIPMAVLPLEAMGGDSLYFADGLSDEIATRLSRIVGLTVIARNNTIRYQSDSTRTVRQIGEALGVAYVLAGSVQWSTTGGVVQVRVRPQLVRVSDGKIIWGDNYTNALTDLFAVQAAVAEHCVDALEVELGITERRAIQASPTSSREAYSLYTLGRFHWKKRTAEGLRLSADYFERAIALDSNFARAYAGLADSYVLFSQFGVTELTRDQAYQKARLAAQTALARDSTLAEAHASLGEVAMYVDRDWTAAEGHFRRAIGLDPNYATGRQWFAELLAVLGRGEEALEQGRRAAELDPTAALAVHAYALAQRALHRFPEAIVQYRRTIEIDPNFGYGQFGLLLSLIGAGDQPGAFRQLEAMGMGTELHRAWVGAAIDSTKAPAARAVVAAHRVEVEAMGPATEAMIQTSVNNADRALLLLSRIVADKGAVLPALQFAEFDRLRADPRFVALVERMGFVPLAR